MTVEFYRFGALQGRIGGRVPSKAAGRKGTRRAWKRAHPPGGGRELCEFFDFDTISAPSELFFPWD